MIAEGILAIWTTRVAQGDCIDARWGTRHVKQCKNNVVKDRRKCASADWEGPSEYFRVGDQQRPLRFL